MIEIVTDLSPSALATANRANLYSFFRRFEHSSAMEFANLDGLARWYSAHPFFWFSAGVLCSRDASPADNILINEMVAYYKSKQAKSICWWLEDGVSRTGWGNLLTPRGFELIDGPPGMGVDLNQLPESIPSPPELEIQIVKDIGMLQSYTHLLTTLFEFPAETESGAYEWARGLGFEMPYISYIAYLNGAPVGTSAVYYGAGVAGIYNVTVAHDVRGQGIGAMLTLQPLRDARKIGYRAGILQASDMGFKVYQRLGFEQNCHLGCFLYKFDGNNK